MDEDGGLRLRLPCGEKHRVVAGDVTVVGGYERRLAAEAEVVRWPGTDDETAGN